MDALADRIGAVSVRCHLGGRLDEIEALGVQASDTGDPALILSYCHEIYCLASELKRAALCDAYSPAMPLDRAELYMAWTLGQIPELRKSTPDSGS